MSIPAFDPPAVEPDLAPTMRTTLLRLVSDTFAARYAEVPDGMSQEDYRISLWDEALAAVGATMEPPVSAEALSEFIGAMPITLKRPGIPGLMRTWLSRRAQAVWPKDGLLAHISGYNQASFAAARHVLEGEGFTFENRGDHYLVTRPLTPDERELALLLEQQEQTAARIAVLQERVKGALNV